MTGMKYICYYIVKVLFTLIFSMTFGKKKLKLNMHFFLTNYQDQIIGKNLFYSINNNRELIYYFLEVVIIYVDYLLMKKIQVMKAIYFHQQRCLILQIII